MMLTKKGGSESREPLFEEIGVPAALRKPTVPPTGLLACVEGSSSWPIHSESPVAHDKVSIFLVRM